MRNNFRTDGHSSFNKAFLISIGAKVLLNADATLTLVKGAVKLVMQLATT